MVLPAECSWQRHTFTGQRLAPATWQPAQPTAWKQRAHKSLPCCLCSLIQPLSLLWAVCFCLQVYLPELEAASRAAGVQDPEEVWEQFGQNIFARQPEEPQQQAAGAQGAAGGALPALIVPCTTCLMSLPEPSAVA